MFFHYSAPCLGRSMDLRTLHRNDVVALLRMENGTHVTMFSIGLHLAHYSVNMVQCCFLFTRFFENLPLLDFFSSLLMLAFLIHFIIIFCFTSAIPLLMRLFLWNWVVVSITSLSTLSYLMISPTLRICTLVIGFLPNLEDVLETFVYPCSEAPTDSYGARNETPLPTGGVVAGLRSWG